MIVSKITEGYVVQLFDTETRQFVSQEFKAGDQVSHEDEEGKNVEAFPEYLPFDMVQPEENDPCVIELPNGGAMTFEKDDGTIRYIDADGNVENVWAYGDEDYDRYKTDYFSELQIESEDESV